MNGYELMVLIRSGREHSKIKPLAFIKRKEFISLMKLYKGLKCKLFPPCKDRECKLQVLH